MINNRMDKQIRRDQAMVTLVFICQVIGGLIALGIGLLALNACFGEWLIFIFS